MDDEIQRDDDKDALYILPLRIIPLETRALQAARLIKNSRLEGVVELFNDRETGSGQVAPEQLLKTFDFAGPKSKDFKIIKALSLLPSYDVYSLRIELRQLGIPVDSNRHLKLSDKQTRELGHYMLVFTKPLIRGIYGAQMPNVESYDGLLRLFAVPDMEEARENLHVLAGRLKIETRDLPLFLRDYGDVYLSLAYYQYCLDENWPRLEEFFDSVEQIKGDPHLRANPQLIARCAEIADKLQVTATEVKSVLEIFRIQTIDMWHDISARKFTYMKELIATYQTKVGGALCAITVKMNAWAKAFPIHDAAGLFRRAEFIMNEMRQGVHLIQPINYADFV